MIEVEKEPERPLLVLKVTGVVHADDYAQTMPKFKELTAAVHPVALLADWTELEGWDEEAASMRFFIRLESRSEFQRMGILAADAWTDEVDRLREVTGIPIRRFDPSERESAIAWLDPDSHW